MRLLDENFKSSIPTAEKHTWRKMLGIPQVNSGVEAAIHAAIKTSELESTECMLQTDATNLFKKIALHLPENS